MSGPAERDVLAGTGAAGTALSAEVPLWRNRDVQLLWSGSAFAFLGKEITDLVYPLIVLTVTGSAACSLSWRCSSACPPVCSPTGTTGGNC